MDCLVIAELSWYRFTYIFHLAGHEQMGVTAVEFMMQKKSEF